MQCESEKEGGNWRSDNALQHKQFSSDNAWSKIKRKRDCSF